VGSTSSLLVVEPLLESAADRHLTGLGATG
jgi:hypothetical protein